MRVSVGGGLPGVGVAVIIPRLVGCRTDHQCFLLPLIHWRCLLRALGRLECLRRGLRALHTVAALTVLGALSAAHLGSTDRAGRWASEQGADLLDQHLDLIGFIQHEVAVCAQLGFLLP